MLQSEHAHGTELCQEDFSTNALNRYWTRGPIGQMPNSQCSDLNLLLIYSRLVSYVYWEITYLPLSLCGRHTSDRLRTWK